MIQNVLREIGGVGIYGVISICLFFAVFSGALIWAWAQKKSFCQTMSTLPLNDGDVRTSNKGVTRDE